MPPGAHTLRTDRLVFHVKQASSLAHAATGAFLRQPLARSPLHVRPSHTARHG